MRFKDLTDKQKKKLADIYLNKDGNGEMIERTHINKQTFAQAAK